MPSKRLLLRSSLQKDFFFFFFAPTMRASSVFINPL